MPRARFLASILLLALVVDPASAAESSGQPPIVTPLSSVGDVSLRGIAMAGAETVWVSGTGGTARRSDDGGGSWRSVAPRGTEELDFRDVELLGGDQALLMSVGSGASSRIYKTDDGGGSWRLVLQNHDEGAFFNALAFWDGRSGVLTSDSADGRPLLLATDDQGESWHRVGEPTLPPLLDGEAGFAASGTTLAAAAGTHLWVATGGATAARVFHSPDRGKSWTVHETPVPAGAPSAGIFSIAFRDDRHGVAVGGDYREPESDRGNAAWTDDGGRSWRRATSDRVFSQKACVQWLGGSAFLAAGRAALAWSADDGHSWRALEAPPFYTITFDPASGVGYLAGSEGRVARFTFEVVPSPLNGAEGAARR